ncbi:AT-hook motif nuclear-localized protein 10-like isoform X2 [Rhodamnia argentea]|uniref:AT-hook motif nuclear-localized protein n=1 Tax=Rhodamnia argentea TaxID=178133 RepID=A0A8B8NJG4_9MYRT|nr:AT-hook motif nuclear-localized protein 10-like isoform X2 [Rhodamnia argentea]
MEDGGVAETGRLGSQVVQQVSAGLGTEGNGDADGGKSRSEAGVGESGVNVAAFKKKRGRPKKYEVQGGVMWSSSSCRRFAPEASVKRRRGRPRGSASGSPHFASIGGRPTGALEGSFSPETVTLHRGEEILAKLSSLIGPDSHSLSILSATGAVSSVVLRQPGPSGGILSYEGYFQILALNGSFTIREGRICTHPELSLVNVMLAMPDGRVFGGGVAGPLIAAGPTQLVAGNFKHNPIHEVRQPEHIARVPEVGDHSGIPNSVLLEPTDKEAKTTITTGSNDVNPASPHIDEHNPLEPVEPGLDRNIYADTKAN